jgi:hypothetical protein
MEETFFATETPRYPSFSPYLLNVSYGRIGQR